MTCHICSRPIGDRYVNEAAGEACVDPCHWPYLTSGEIAYASIAYDRITRALEPFDVHENGQTRLTVPGEQVTLLPLPNDAIPSV